MKMAEIRFLEKGEQAVLPAGGKLLPKGWQKVYAERRKPFRLEEEGDRLTAILQTEKENAMTAIWRKNTARLLEILKKKGAAIVIPPAEGDLPGDLLPFAAGRRLVNLFAFRGAAEALKRQGKNPEACTYLLAGGNPKTWRGALISMGNEVNRLAIFTPDPDGAKDLVQELFAERGLMAEVFSSPKNPVFQQADVVFCCGMEQRAYEHMLKEGAVWVDLACNRPLLRNLRERRRDVAAMDGFFFRRGKKQVEGRFAEAEAFLSCPIFRENWQFLLAEAAGKEMLCELEERGYAVSGFSLFGKRVKIMRKP